MHLRDEALAFSRCVVSVMGDHAGEGSAAIFQRKAADIERAGRTLWLVRSPKARPPRVQELCRNGPAFALFVEPARHGGARPTMASSAATQFSADGERWQPLPSGIGPVTGKLDATASGLVLDRLETVNGGTLDLWNYGQFPAGNEPVKFILGCSTVCTVRKDTSLHDERTKSRYRLIVAVARLANPYGVWLR